MAARAPLTLAAIGAALLLEPALVWAFLATF
jgi:hypothetical protein